jgi:hypothetical protein
MPRVNVYLPDDLHNEVKAARIEVSAVCQSALREAVAVKEQGVGVQLEALQAAVRLRRTTPQGRRDIGAIDGTRWARETATVKELQTIGQITVRELDYAADDGEPFFEVQWDGDGDALGGANFIELRPEFTTLGKWLVNKGHAAIDGETFTVDADAYLQGFVEAAQTVWHELKPLVDEDEAVLRRRIGLLQRMEHNMLTHGQLTDNAAAAEPGQVAESEPKNT